MERRIVLIRSWGHDGETLKVEYQDAVRQEADALALFCMAGWPQMAAVCWSSEKRPWIWARQGWESAWEGLEKGKGGADKIIILYFKNKKIYIFKKPKESTLNVFILKTWQTLGRQTCSLGLNIAGHGHMQNHQLKSISEGKNKRHQYFFSFFPIQITHLQSNVTMSTFNVKQRLSSVHFNAMIWDNMKYYKTCSELYLKTKTKQVGY